MNDLPDPASDAGNKPVVPPTMPQTGGITSKEKGEVGTGLEAPTLKEVGREFPLSSEAAASGVKLHPTSVTLPGGLQKMGVKSVGDVAIPVSSGAAALPLTDDQIAVGLHQGIASSWRWLAEWCVRKLKQLHLALKRVHGTFTRVKQ